MSDEITKRPEDRLTEIEREELYKWKRTPAGDIPLSTTVAVKMYQLFLLGHSCDEIVRVNENRFSLGMVIDARLRHDWDRRRDAYVERLYEEAGNVVKQRQIESGLFLGDVLAAAHVEHGEKLRRFLQTKDPKDLPEVFKITSITTYKMVVDALMKITGQDSKKGDSGPGVLVQAGTVNLSEAPRPMDGKDAFSLLKVLDTIDAEASKKK